MGFLRKTLDQIKTMMGQLAFSQRMLIVTLLAIVVVSVVWMTKFAGQADQVPVFDQAFGADEQGRLVSTLKANGVNCTVKDNKVMVSPADRQQAHAVLAANDALPKDFSYGFEHVVQDNNIWRTQNDRDRLWCVAVENELANVLRKFPNVTDAKVIVDRPEKRGFGGATAEQPSAAVHLRMRAGQAIDKKLVVAVADWVSGAVRDLPRDRVKLIDSTSGRSYRVPSEEAGIPADLLELTLQHEEHFSQGILKALGIKDVLVSVSVKVDPANKKETAVTVGDGTGVSYVASETGRKSTSTEGGAGGGGEPGAVPNAGGMTVSNAPVAAGGRSNETEESTTYAVRPDSKTTVKSEAAGAISQVSATVNIPRSYFLAAMKEETKQDNPDAAALKTFTDNQITLIKPKVLAAIGLTAQADDAKVAVGWYYDSPIETAKEVPTTESASMVQTMMAHAPSIGLGVLAVISLLMMLLMMRKAAASAGTFTATDVGLGRPRTVGSLAMAGASAADADADADADLDEVHVDSQTRRAQKVVEQVSGMVRQNPDAAANLVRRWINKGGK